METSLLSTKYPVTRDPPSSRGRAQDSATVDLVTSMTSGGLLGGSGGPGENKYCLKYFLNKSILAITIITTTVDAMFVFVIGGEHIAKTHREVSLV